MTTIPASAIVNVQPNVLAAGGSALDLVGLLLTTDTRVPIGSIQSFASAAAVSDFFGATSQMADLGAIYFNGFDGSRNKPGNLLVAQYALDAVGAYIRGGDASTLTLAQLQAFSGTLSIVIDGVTKSASINLASATSFSNAASIVGSSLNIQGPQVGTITGSIAGGTLTVTGTLGFSLAVGDVLSGTGVTAATFITSLLTGTGGTGTYGVSPSQSAASQTITVYAPPVTYDSVSGGFVIISPTTGASSTITYGSGAMATDLLLTAATGATLSQGTGAASPSTFMDAIILQTQDWATFATAFDPDTSGFTNKLAFAAWTNGQNQRYGYVAWDTDATPGTTDPAMASFGYSVIITHDYSGTFPIGGVTSTTGPEKAAFVLGIGASIDFEQANGRTTYAFRSQSGLVADVTDQTTANNFLANGYNFYGVYATANSQFTFLYNGSVSGPFAWMDSYINQIWLNNAFQLALMQLLTNTFSIPYNAAGRAQIEAALADPINAGLAFGAFRAGVTLSAAQVSAVNAAAGANVAPTLQNNGWYLQVLDASPAVRAARGSPPCTFWYVDGGSVQSINLESVEVQ